MRRIDAMRKMTVRELAKELNDALQVACPCDWCGALDGRQVNCNDCIADWLTEEIGEEDCRWKK